MQSLTDLDAKLFLLNAMSKSADVKPWSKNHSYFWMDYAFNNAGIEGDSAPTADCTEEKWDKTIAINLKGVVSVQHEITEM
jgi:NAD(P)-dependent dehydrogenase (short-subunit alcohol dehydrogenase family)